jgi:hypothetical protein
VGLTDAQRRSLEAKLYEQLRQDCDIAESIGYRARIFRRMLASSGPVVSCMQLITSDRIADGFITLLELNRLDITVEATVLRGPWKALFDDSVLERARVRLREYRRADLADI